MLSLGLEGSQIYLVSDKTTPKDMWDVLVAHYDTRTTMSKMLLKSQFFTFKMGDNTGMEDHFRRFKELVDRLKAAGSPPDEEDQVVVLLNSLGPKYDTLVTALQTKEAIPQLELVMQSLLNEEGRKQGSTGGSSQEALMGVRKGGQWDKPAGCWTCGSEDHYQSNCLRGGSSGGQGYRGQNRGRSGRGRSRGRGRGGQHRGAHSTKYTDGTGSQWGKHSISEEPDDRAFAVFISDNIQKSGI